MAVLGPKLTQRTLNQSLLKHLAKLQVCGGDGWLHYGVLGVVQGIQTATSLSWPREAQRCLGVCLLSF